MKSELLCFTYVLQNCVSRMRCRVRLIYSNTCVHHAASYHAGIPARLTGVLHWNQDKSVCPDGDASPDCGNHNWVEAYLDGEWCFLDEAGDGRVNHGWFYPGNSDHQVPNTRNHSIYSSSYAPAKLLDASLYPSTSFPIDHYPLAWDIHYEGVHGWDNTVQYINHTFSS